MPGLSFKSKRLYMRGLGKDIDEADLFHNLSLHGKIREMKILSNYAFVQYESEEDATTVLNIYRTEPLMGKRIVIEFAHPLRRDIPAIMSNMYAPQKPYRCSKMRHPVVVLGLPRDMRWQELKDFGRSSGVLVAFCDLDKRDQGRGFIEFFSREDAKYAVTVLDGRTIRGRKVSVIDHEDLRKVDSVGRHMNNLSASLRQEKASEYALAENFDTPPSRLNCRPPLRQLPWVARDNVERDGSKAWTGPAKYAQAMHCRVSYEESSDGAYCGQNVPRHAKTEFQYDHEEPPYRLASCHDAGAYYNGLSEYHNSHQEDWIFDPYQ